MRLGGSSVSCVSKLYPRWREVREGGKGGRPPRKTRFRVREVRVGGRV